MEDEGDVDIEGDAFEVTSDEGDTGALDREQFVQSAWKSNAGVLPWELDSSISPENREVIQRMLLEEQYYLTGQNVSNRIWEIDGPIKPKAKRSPAKPAASASGGVTRWSKHEKELFEEGLAQFGRRWTKVAKLVGSRSVLQVKSYARQYFKQKGKVEHKTAVLTAAPAVKLLPSQPTSSEALTLANTVRIEKLSDEENEEVDITDDLSDDGDCKEPQDVKNQQRVTDACTDSPAQKSVDPSPMVEELDNKMPESPLQSSSRCHFDCTARDDKNTNGRMSPDVKHLQEGFRPVPAETPVENDALSFQPDALPQTCPLEREGTGCTGFSGESERVLDEKPDDEEEEVDGDEEIKAPEKEIELDKESITEDEKQAIPEFFEGRPSKTPDRYLKIRNYILDQWMNCKPRYLNKTSVRPGLKNCGDVNCIGRIHTYLELVGAINFNCEQAVYNRPKVVDRSKQKEGKDVLEAYLLAQRLQSMRARKRRVRDTWGNWCDAKDLEGQTYEHLSAEELAKRREEMKKQPKTNKTARFKGSLDPFQLIPCRSFGEDVQEPFQVIVCAETLIVMDMHAHVSRGEVIGLLGGTFDEEKKVLKICVAEPCNSVSTGMQCEMDPVSQTQACDLLSSLGYSVVGWYHSHPSFHPNPSVRDINTQDQLQSYFSRGGAPFIGMIVSPYDPANRSPHSQTTCLLVKEMQDTPSSQKLPYRFDFLLSPDSPDWEQTLRRAQWIIYKYSQSPGSVQMNKFFRQDCHLTCLEKMMSSLAKYLESMPDEDGEPFLHQIQALFLTDFIAKQQASKQEEGEILSNSPRLANSDELDDYLTSDEESLEEQGNVNSDSGRVFDNALESTDNRSEGNNPIVLHMGSVLSSEHDYLL